MSEETHTSIEEIAGEVEAVLFVHGEPIKAETMVKIISGARAQEGRKPVTLHEILSAVKFLEERLRTTESALLLVENKEEIQLATRPEVAKTIGELVKMELNEALTPAALETLAIIAYTGPVTRSNIDYIRGVNSSFILRTLLIRGLIDRAPHEERANTYAYTPSIELLKHLGLTRKESLPEYKEFEEAIKTMSQIQKSEA